ncbi:unnamed protein product [Ambrosiozyma monospora]|uniref:Unnamed protein product n=1 Tax=Ambrosiozyma monospora TaxID=43982 RepID=A0A9W6YVF9_AMBMO|nr:unnamed protein product [Ambrosiozyma monospora]
MTTEQFHAIGIESYDENPTPKAFSYTPQEQRPHDVDIEIEACGKVVKVAPSVTRFKPGDRVGVGAQCDSCGCCHRCIQGKPNNCRDLVCTYQASYPETGVNTQGGYADFIRVHEKFAFKIPDQLDSTVAAPLLCGGITGFKPLLTAGVTKGTRVGVVGIGGIGHMTILFAKAMGAEVTAISRNDGKKKIARELGADHYISTDEEGYVAKYADSLDVIVNTGKSFSENGVSDVASLMDAGGQLIFITAPPSGEKIELSPFFMLFNNYSIGGSVVGTPKEIEQMLQFAADHDIKPWIETIDMNEKNVKTVWQRMEKA